MNLPKPSPSHYIRKGKLEELRLLAEEAKANILVFNVDLSPSQARNIEKVTKVPALDRTGLILDIFGRRARTSEGKLQVELAKLHYSLPRLGGLGGVMSRLGGGIGTRGPGEQELEWDRRKIRRRIQRVKEELVKVKKHRELLREGRRKKNFFTVALVGYTNAGKSTLLNALTNSDVYVKDQLFATLDPTTRIQTPPYLRQLDEEGVETMVKPRNILFIDTVGFIEDLPHALVEAFHATLEEVCEADLLVHVVDGTNPAYKDQKKAVESVLEEIKAHEKPTIMVLNKMDCLDNDRREDLKLQWKGAYQISAKEKLGTKQLMAHLSELTLVDEVR